MRGSDSGMNLRVSSSDDQMTWRTPAAFAAFAMWRASSISFSGREVRPEERDEVRAVRALERAGEARLVVDVRRHDLRTRLRECAGLLRIDVARDRACRKAACGVREDRPHESAALRAGGADDGDDLPVCHGSFPR